MNQRPTYNPLELLRRWLQGATPLEEERQLEQAAEQDPFLAEALEGYRRHPEGRHVERVEHLKARIRGKQRKNRGVIHYLPRLAAAALALALMVGGFWYINQDNTNLSAFAIEEQSAEKSADTSPEKTAKEIEEQSIPPAVDEAIPSQPEQQKEPRMAEKQTPIDSRPATQPLIQKEKKKVQDSSIPPAEEGLKIARAEPDLAPPESQSQALMADEIKPYSFEKKEISVREAEDNAQDVAAAKALPAAPQNDLSAPPAEAETRTIRGYVLDENGEPLIGANVLLDGSNLGTVTNIEGQFELELPDSLNPGLIVSYTGYSSQKMIVPEAEDSLAIVLSESEGLLESVVVSGYNASREQKAPVPRPVNGLGKFRQYIRDNLNYPEAARQDGIEGKVMLKFRIQGDGSPGDFQVEKRLGYGCDEEAIRLLKEGPKWEGVGQEVTYTIRFKL